MLAGFGSRDGAQLDVWGFMAVDEISISSERVGSPDEKSLMCIFYSQHGGPKAVNIVDVVGGLEGGGLHSLLITQLFTFCMSQCNAEIIMAS